MDPYTHTRDLSIFKQLNVVSSGMMLIISWWKISHVLCNSEMPTAHINSLLLTAPILNTLKLSDFCCIESDAMKSRELSLMMQGHFKIPVSFSAALLRFYTAVRHQSIIPNLAVSLNYGDRNKLFWQLSTSDTDFF